jgi:protein-L-isoaspartate O-methyltransferase
MSLSPFVPSSNSVVEYMLKLAELKPKEVFVDIGAGDGRTVIMAAKLFGAQSIGIELREDLAKKALTTIHENGLENQVTIINDDIFNVSLITADVVYLYLTTSANEKIKPKLERDLKPGTRIISHDYEIMGWHPEKIEKFCENPQLGHPSHTIYLYIKQAT